MDALFDLTPEIRYVAVYSGLRKAFGLPQPALSAVSLQLFLFAEGRWLVVRKAQALCTTLYTSRIVDLLHERGLAT